MYRKRSYPHVYPPLKSLHFKGSRRKSSPRHSESESAEGNSDVSRFPSWRIRSKAVGDHACFLLQPSTSRKNSKTEAESEGQSPPEIPIVVTSDEEKDGRRDGEGEAPVSERAALSCHDGSFGGSSDAFRRVQFQIGR